MLPFIRSSDDPTYFDCSIAGDMRTIAGLTDLDVERHTGYAIEASFTPDDEKDRLRTVVSEWWRDDDGGSAEA